MSKFPIKPLQDRLVVLQSKNKLNHGGMIFQVSNERPTEGEVLEVGPDVKGLKEGDYVVFANYSGQEVPGATSQADSIPIMLREHEVIGIVDRAMLRELEEAAHAKEREASESLLRARQEYLDKNKGISAGPAPVSITDG